MIPDALSLAALGAVLAASLLGSMHCAGMCGAFVAFAVAADDSPARRQPQWILHVSYNGGRLVTYASLGAISGLVGSAVDLGGSMVGVQRLAAGAAGLMMVLFGAAAALRLLGVSVPHAPVPGVLRRLAQRGYAASMRLPPAARAASVGLLTTLLPCGFLYAFVVASASTAHPVGGALFMAAFWLGTLPVMVAVGAGIRALAGPFKRHVPLLTALALMVVGLATIAGRLSIPTLEPAPVQAGPVSLEEAVEGVRTLDHAELPCCRGGK